jgi:hypothetical protein
MLARVTSGRKLAALALKDLDEHIIVNALSEYFCPYNVGTLSEQAPQEKIGIVRLQLFRVFRSGVASPRAESHSPSASVRDASKGKPARKGKLASWARNLRRAIFSLLN